ncbi:class I adenylate-forming enzyme family protein [Nocardioides humi]|uniref:Long-chain fatty acid--CoA ligase n=1 Tax=Nocardioides humi TaxID=449461 RepID=A0ABN2A7C5_9ACTN|nr:class I adenylate-forming enzyme family protein [Nocardioides humi]
MNAVDSLRIDRVFLEKAAQRPDAVALVVDDRSWTRADVRRMAESAAAFLRERGVGPGDRVLAQYTTDARDLAVAVAASGLGATLIPVPTSLGGLELSHILRLAEPVVAIAHGAELPHGTTVPAGVAVVDVADVTDVTEGRGIEVPCLPVPTDHTAVIGVTSGSTGLPKGVMHTWSSLHYAASHAAAVVRVRDGEAICTPGASAGAPGYAFFTYLGLAHGATIVRASRWNADAVLDLMARHRVVWSMTVVSMVRMFVDAARKRPEPPDLSAMRAMCVGGSAIASSLVHEAKDVLGVDAIRMFGLSECLGFATMSPADPLELRAELDGYPYAGTEVHAFDDERRMLPPGEVGEAGVRGPSLMQGYLGDTDPDSRMAPGGYFLTGDWIRMTDDGHVKVVGRKKDLIIRGGYNIDPSEIENLVRARADVLEASVFGLPDERLGEIVCLCVVPQPGAAPGLDEIVDDLRARGLSTQKLPQVYATRDAFPLSPDGKVLKEVIRREVQAERETEAAR